MTNTFDFFNYTFSGLISIFAALVGMAYPLILQAIQRIDNMYKSTLLAGYVQRQKPIRRFNVLLLVSVVFAILVPYLLREFRGEEVICIILTCAHSFVTLLLLLSIVSLFHFLQLTSRPLDFLDYIKKNPDGGKPDGGILYASQIAKFASDRNDIKLYIESSSYIYEVFHNLRQSGEVYETYPLQAKETLGLLTSYYAEKPIGLMSNSSLLCSIHFEIDKYVPFSDGDFEYIWRTLDTVLQTGSESFISGYWSFADQYYRFVIHNHFYQEREDKAVKAFHDRYLEFHTMLGAMLVFNKRYALLKTLMYFSNDEPPYYYLVPGSFERIRDSLVSLWKKKDYFFSLSHCYLMTGMTSDVKCDNDILATAFRYHAILMVRLFTINDYFVFSKSKAIPDVTAAKIEDIEKDIRIMNQLIAYIEEYYESGLLKECFPTIPKQEDVVSLVNQYIDACNAKIKAIKEAHEIDYKKIEYIRDNMAQAAERPLQIPNKVEVTTDESHFSSIFQPVWWKFPISSEIVESGTYTNASNLPELVVDTLNQQIYKIYNSIFVRTPAAAVFTIDIKDVKKALIQMGINDTFAVISLGVYFGTFDDIFSKGEDLFDWDGDKMSYHGARFYNVPSVSNSLIVLKKEDVPCYSIAENDEAGLTEIGTGLGLYSNIDDITIEEQQFELHTRRCINLHYVKDMKYVRLVIKHYSDKEWDIDKINDTLFS